MKPFAFLVILILTVNIHYAQQITADELLEKAIAYHDPANNWPSFNGKLNIVMETPDNPNRVSEISIDLPGEYFFLKAKRDTVETQYELDQSRCKTSIIDSTDARRTPCETAKLYKNYYTYLYGLPMKLKDPGTIIDPKVLRKKFKGKEYLVIKASYEENVGSDVWFFYFDPKRYGMEIYQFFKGAPDGDGKDSGEYILLSEEVIINDIKMPKIRAWYYNKDDKYLGTDILQH